MKKSGLLAPAIGDIAVLLLFASMLVSNTLHGDQVSAQLFNPVFVIVTGFYLSRLVILCRVNIIHSVITALIQIWAIFEAAKGILQIIGLVHSNNSLFICTGSFDNPGPYGGFLAVCCSVSLFGLLDSRYRAGASVINKLLAYVSILMCSIVLPSTQSRAALLALMCSGAVFVFANAKARSYLRMYWKLLLMLILVAFAVIFMFKRQSASGRLFINKMNLRTMVDNRMQGVGMGHFPNAYGNTQMTYFKKRIGFAQGELVYDRSDKERQTADTPNAPFNEYLRIGIEFGLCSMVLFLSVCLFSLYHLYSKGSPLLYCMVSMSVFALFSYPFSQWQFLTLLVICIAYSASEQKTDRALLCRVGMPLVLSVIFICLTIPKLGSMRECQKGKADWEKQRFLYEGKQYENYGYCCSQLYESQKYNYAFLYEYAYSLFMNGMYPESESIAMQGLKLNCNPLFYCLLGDLYKAQGRLADAEREYQNAFYLLPDRLFPLGRLATLYHESGDSVRFRNMVMSIREFEPRVESASTQSIRRMVNEMAEQDYLVCE